MLPVITVPVGVTVGLIAVPPMIAAPDIWLRRAVKA